MHGAHVYSLLTYNMNGLNDMSDFSHMGYGFIGSMCYPSELKGYRTILTEYGTNDRKTAKVSFTCTVII